MTLFHPLRVAQIRRETRDAVVLTLEVPEALRAAFAFHPGQYLTLRAIIDGAEVRRSYSLCSAPGGACRVGVKRVADGRFSSWVNQVLRPGDVVEAMPPMGNFGLAPAASNRRHYLGIAAGSGITPLLSIIRAVLETEPRSRFSLVYGNRASSTIMFREELEDLKNLHLGRLGVTHILSREQQEVDLFNGRIDRAKCDALLRSWIDVGSVDLAFICGPREMMADAAASLEAHGLAKSQIQFELFAGDDGGRRARAAAPAATDPGQGCRATVTLHGRSLQFGMARTKTILEAALAEGLDAPYACKAGVCSTCRAMLLEGQVDMDANYALEDYEIARGYVLTCQSYPVSDTIVADYDR